MKTSRIATWASLALTFASVLPAADLANKKAITLEVAKQLAQTAEAFAAKNKWTMVITVVDDGGNVVYLARMDETQIGSIEVAIEKAKSAVNFKRPTKAFEDIVVGGRNTVLKLPGSLPVEGGIPLMVEGKLIGAIGVSGGTSVQDGQAATAAVEALPKILGH